MKTIIIGAIIIFLLSCTKSSDKQEIFKCKINNIEYSSTNAIVKRDSNNIKFTIRLNNEHYFDFEVKNLGAKSYNLGYDDKWVKVIGDSKMYYLTKPSNGNGTLNIEAIKGWDFNRRMSGTFHFSINPSGDDSYIVKDGVFKNIPIVDY
jgi:hypothetical protein